MHDSLKFGDFTMYGSLQEFPVTSVQKMALEAAVSRDTAFLMAEGLMDYSLLLGVRYR